MIETIKRNGYRISRNFTALVILLMTFEFLVGPIYYIVGLAQHGWYSLAPWQIKMMITSPFQSIEHFALLAIFLIMFYETLKMLSVVALRIIGSAYKRFSFYF